MVRIFTLRTALGVREINENQLKSYQDVVYFVFGCVDHFTITDLLDRSSSTPRGLGIVARALKLEKLFWRRLASFGSMCGGRKQCNWWHVSALHESIWLVGCSNTTGRSLFLSVQALPRGLFSIIADHCVIHTATRIVKSKGVACIVDIAVVVLLFVIRLVVLRIWVPKLSRICIGVDAGNVEFRVSRELLSLHTTLC